MKKSILIVVILGMLGWAVYDFIDSNEKMDTSESSIEAEEQSSSKGKEDTVIGLNVGNIAPDFQLQTLEGDNVKLSDFRGERVMLNFWATWCPPCRAEMPDMKQFHQDKDVVILAVNLTDAEKDLQQVEDFVNEYELTFPILLDENIEVAELYMIQPIPTSFMIDSNGLIHYKAFGAMNYELMVQELEKMD
ncbi:peroxiredoxin family protein [Paucisalibacillus globulus]|uniref:peroxiredoxin family protein n=1 Tax=Paucisalibacillus globulus TaxID=351095 RepID=UPI0004103FEB|nr:redoxin domain-containing protein [Paucisalibacillus globulus]